MDIKTVKSNIRDCARSYFAKKPDGSYLISPEKQRPVFLMGPPGVGKSDVVEQIAHELGVPFLSYSMAHHTRQSILGLPYLSTETFGGKEVRVTSYTLSEMLAEVYRAIRESGRQEGILFLDEINCCSETLSPIQLGFLQKKTLGTFRLPEGWMIVSAGNPKEYNLSVHEFDAATMDRLRTLDIEPSYEAWKEYALNHRIHPSVISFLDIYSHLYFYRSEKNPMKGQQIVTARSWSELSDTLRAYETIGADVTAECISQFLRISDVYNEFYAYYQMFHKFYVDFRPLNILENRVEPAQEAMIRSMSLDERMILTHVLIDVLLPEIGDVIKGDEALLQLRQALTGFAADPSDTDRFIALLRERYTEDASEAAEEMLKAISPDMPVKEALNTAAGIFNDCLQRNAEQAEKTKRRMVCAVEFISRVYGEESAELTVFITDVLLNEKANAFVFRYDAFPELAILQEFDLHATERRLENELQALDMMDKRKECA